MAVIGRTLEAQGFRVGIIAQPDWQSAEPFKALGRPNLFFGVTAGNMDSMINRYTADRKIRQRRRLHAGRAGRQAARPRSARLRAALQGGLERRAHRHGWHRGQPAPHRPLRLLAGQGAPLHPGRRQGRPAAVRQCRARHHRDRAPPGRARACRAHHRRARHRLHAPHRRPHGSGMVRNRFHRGRPPRPYRQPHQPLPDDQRAGRRAGQQLREGRRCQSDRRGRAADPIRALGQWQGQSAAARAHRDPPAQLRAGEERPGAVRPRQPRAAPGDQPRQRPRAGAGHGTATATSG